MSKNPIAALNELASNLTAQFAGLQANVTSFSSGAAMLDVNRDGRAWVMAYSPTHGFGVEELGPTEGLMTAFRFVSPHFEAAARHLNELTRKKDNSHPPRISLIVLQARDIDQTKDFYTCLGLSFSEEKHGAGPRHYAAVLDGIVFEIYPCRTGPHAAPVRLGLRVAELDEIVETLQNHGVAIVSEPADSPWGRRAVVRDPDGNAVELNQDQAKA